MSSLFQEYVSQRFLAKLIAGCFLFCKMYIDSSNHSQKLNSINLSAVTEMFYVLLSTHHVNGVTEEMKF